MTKHERIIALLEKHRLDGLLIRQVANFAWATDGAASYINTASTYGAGTLLITQDARYLITNTIEAPRFDQEEQLRATGWEFHAEPWYLSVEALAKLTKGLKLGTDFAFPGAIDLAGELIVERSYLTRVEQDQFRVLSANCAAAMNAAIQAVKPGQTENEIAAILGAAAQKRGVQPIVNLIATDERIYKFRHPLPTTKIMDKYAMLVLSGRQKGLVCSITRLVHVGKLSAELADKQVATATVEATMIAATRPGQTVANIFKITQDAYAQVGYPDEYQLHHQGGPAGFNPREFIATPTTNHPIKIGQAYAWNPSITGTKSEDTILVGPETNEVMTTIPSWPTLSVEVDGQTINRPAILVKD
jgi:Xaa-Pro aminopeptidase